MPRNRPTKSEAQPTLLSVKQVAQLDGTSERTVRRAIVAGRLAVVRIGPGGTILRISPDAHEVYRRSGAKDD